MQTLDQYLHRPGARKGVITQGRGALQGAEQGRRSSAAEPRTEERIHGTRSSHQAHPRPAAADGRAATARTSSSPRASRRRSRSTARSARSREQRAHRRAARCALVRSIMNDKQTEEFDATKECNFAIAPPGIGRFRVNAFVQQGHVGMRAAHDQRQDPDVRGARAAADRSRTSCMTKRGLVHLRRRHRLGQVDLARGDDRLPQREHAAATSSRSRTRSSTCTSTRTASSRSARSASTPTAGSTR